MPAARARRAGPGSGRARVGGSAASARGLRASRSIPKSRAASTSRRRESSGCMEAWCRRSSGRSPRSGLPGIRASAPRSAGSPLSRRRVSRVSGRRSSWSAGNGGVTSARLCRSRSCRSRPIATRSWRAWACAGLGSWPPCPGGAVAERLGREGRQAWGLARGGEKGRVHGRRQAAELAEALEFPEAVGNELTLRRAFGALLDRLLARPERAGRPLRKAALSARLVGGGSWRWTVTLREPTAKRPRLRAALGPKLLEIPGPVLELRLEAVELSALVGQQLGARQAGRRRAERAPERRVAPGAREHRLRLGRPRSWRWRRGRGFPESRALFVPRDE